MFDLQVTIESGKDSAELVLVTQAEHISGNPGKTTDRVITVDETAPTPKGRPVGGADCATVEGTSIVDRRAPPTPTTTPLPWAILYRRSKTHE
ncbi:hypothetical protein [Nocardia brasiliensis]|uniref:hypothetical protein n=1 Tax=Nocardia brasiliensis TaxID=37326 RepID=UPI0004A7192C|nr:hypothetical protein [Nocardia brasiliensis]